MLDRTAPPSKTGSATIVRHATGANPLEDPLEVGRGRGGAGEPAPPLTSTSHGGGGGI